MRQDSYPHPLERVEAKLYKKWWEIPSAPNYTVKLPALAYIEDGKEVVTAEAFHKLVVVDCIVFRAMKLESAKNMYELDGEAYLQGNGYGVFNDIKEVKASSRLAAAINKFDLAALSDEQVSALADNIIQRLEKMTCVL